MTVTIKLELDLDMLMEAINSLDFEAKRKLWTMLNQEMQGIEVEGSNEIISFEEITVSENAWQNYISGRDTGISSQDLKKKLLGENCA
jgi:hypothetical protein